MTSTTNPNFDATTQALDVASFFPNSIRNKTILVTGVNPKGIGFATVEALASQSPSLIIIAGRNPTKLQESISTLHHTQPTISIRPLILDLSSQATVRSAAAELLSWPDVPEINILINSAGIMTLPERTLNSDGIEMTFATNHLGHYLFTNLIMPKLLASAASSPKGATRIVNVSSLSPTWGGIRWSDINFDRVNSELPREERPNYDLHRRWAIVDPEKQSYLPLEGYNQSKAANLLFSIASNARLFEKHGILSLTVHPGVIMTELGRNAKQEQKDAVAAMKLTYKTLGGGASTSLVAALDPKLGLSERTNGKENWGVYLSDCQIFGGAHVRAESSAEAEKLWVLSEQLVKEKFEW